MSPREGGNPSFAHPKLISLVLAPTNPARLHMVPVLCRDPDYYRHVRAPPGTALAGPVSARLLRRCQKKKKHQPHNPSFGFQHPVNMTPRTFSKDLPTTLCHQWAVLWLSGVCHWFVV